MRELLLARRLLEAAVDPDVPRSASENIGAEMAELNARLGVEAGRLLPVGDFEGLTPDDLSPQAWLLLLETRSEDDHELPHQVLDAIYVYTNDPVLRFRLVSGALSQLRTRHEHEHLETALDFPASIDELPASWPKTRIIELERLAAAPSEVARRAAEVGLLQFVLYLLQDSSGPALQLVAAALAPREEWRMSARHMAVSIVRTADPNLTGYCRRFLSLDL